MQIKTLSVCLASFIAVGCAGAEMAPEQTGDAEASVDSTVTLAAGKYVVTTTGDIGGIAFSAMFDAQIKSDATGRCFGTTDGSEGPSPGEYTIYTVVKRELSRRSRTKVYMDYEGATKCEFGIQLLSERSVTLSNATVAPGTVPPMPRRG